MKPYILSVSHWNKDPSRRRVESFSAAVREAAAVLRRGGGAGAAVLRASDGKVLVACSKHVGTKRRKHPKCTWTVEGKRLMRRK